MTKRIISVILCILWALLIFSFSSDTGVKSKSKSEAISVYVIKTLTSIEENTEEMDYAVQSVSFPIRKCAHLFLYFVFSILVFNAYINFKTYKYDYIIVFIIVLLFSISDEIHQLFSFGRAGKLSDVLIDMIAALFGILLFKILRRKKYESID